MSNRVRVVLDVLVLEEETVNVGQSLKKAEESITGFVVDGILVEGGHYKVEKVENVHVHQHKVGPGSACSICRTLGGYRDYDGIDSNI